MQKQQQKISEAPKPLETTDEGTKATIKQENVEDTNDLDEDPKRTPEWPS